MQNEFTFVNPNAEQWKVVERFPSIEVSSFGRFRSTLTGRLRKCSTHECGYLKISIGKCPDGKLHCCIAHRLVALAFLPPPPSADYCVVNHLNKNRQDNRVSNLEWSTHSLNAIHSKKVKFYHTPFLIDARGSKGLPAPLYSSMATGK